MFVSLSLKMKEVLRASKPRNWSKKATLVCPTEEEDTDGLSDHERFNRLGVTRKHLQ
jgi:hypothetical protein